MDYSEKKRRGTKLAEDLRAYAMTMQWRLMAPSHRPREQDGMTALPSTSTSLTSTP